MSILLNAVRRVIVIVGCQRSGTTLTGQILGADRHSLLLDEWDGLYPWFHALGSDKEPTLAQALLERAAGKYHQPGLRVSGTGSSLMPADSINTLVLKAPNLTFDFDRLAALRVPVSLVYPVRDPRSVVASMMRLNHIDFIGNQYRLITARPAVAAIYAADLELLVDEKIPTWIRYATLWKIKSGRTPFLEALGITPFQFRYEDLVTRRDSIISALSAACALTDIDALKAPETVYTGLGPGATDRTRTIDQSALETWRQALSPNQQLDIMMAAGALVGEFDYE